MRPGIDIPHGTHGRVLDFAEREGITVSAGYEQVLEAGFDELGVD